MKGRLEKSLLEPVHTDVLTSEQRDILKILGFTRKLDFYLAGGTGLALYLAHRTSIDFDFYSFRKFKDLSRYFKEGEIIMDSEDTFEIKVKNTNLSFFYYPYKLIRRLNSFKEIYVASIEDISAMKIIAIVQRGNFRDFIDIYFLIKKFGLKSIINWTKQKYSGYSTFLILKGLTYFEDADRTAIEDEKRIKIFEKITWREIKKFIGEEVRKYAEELKRGEDE